MSPSAGQKRFLDPKQYTDHFDTPHVGRLAVYSQNREKALVTKMTTGGATFATIFVIVFSLLTDMNGFKIFEISASSFHRRIMGH